MSTQLGEKSDVSGRLKPFIARYAGPIRNSWWDSVCFILIQPARHLEYPFGQIIAIRN